MLTNEIFDGLVDQRLDTIKRAGSTLEFSGISNHVVGGFAVFLHVTAVNPIAARMTPDIDFGIRRSELDATRAALLAGGFIIEDSGFRYVDSALSRSVVHLVFLNEEVADDYLEPVPSSESVRTQEGVPIAPVVDLVHMKLTSYRLKDQVHIQDLDHAGLITPGIEQTLSATLLARLKEVRSKR
jgi:hypothetical protein